MNKADLLKAIASASDDAHIFLYTNSFDPSNDFTWSSDMEAEIKSIKVNEDGDIDIIVDCEEFNYW